METNFVELSQLMNLNILYLRFVFLCNLKINFVLVSVFGSCELDRLFIQLQLIEGFKEKDTNNFYSRKHVRQTVTKLAHLYCFIAMNQLQAIKYNHDIRFKTHFLLQIFSTLKVCAAFG